MFLTRGGQGASSRGSRLAVGLLLVFGFFLAAGMVRVPLSAAQTDVAPASPAIIQSDDFHGAELDTTVWRFIDPVGDATLVMSGTNVVVSVPGGTNHDVQKTGIRAPRLMQYVANGDFEVEAKFDSRGSRAYQGQGILVQEDGNTYLRFEIIFTSTYIQVYAAYFDAGVRTDIVATKVTPCPPYLKVTRTANTWKYWYSHNGVSWTKAKEFTQAMAVAEAGFYFSNTGFPGSSWWSAPAFVGNADYFFNTASRIVPEDDGTPTVVTPPVVEVWYGPNQDFGQLGVPQQWVNILGRVWDTEQVDTLYYSLNGGASSGLTIGPDGMRLVGVGDYNVEIDYEDLIPGINNLVITAIDTLGERRDTTVAVSYTDGVPWAQPYVASFETANEISDVAHVVDGRWYLVPGEGVRVDSSATGYDRLIVIGDKTWTTDYEVLLPMTIHASSLGGRGAGVGLLIGWQGHTGTAQPRVDTPYQTISWIRDFPTNPTLYLEDHNAEVSSQPVVEANVRYLMRTRSQSIGNGFSRVTTRFWEEGTTEPANWNLTIDSPTIGGSVLLIGHQSITTFGDVTITHVPSLAPRELTINIVGNGTVVREPNQTSYAEGDTVVVTAVPDTSWAFDGWSAGLTGNENPDTLVVQGDSTITATFVEVASRELTINIVGNGAVVKDPNQTSYAEGDTVVVTAVPETWWAFDGWSGGLTGSVNPDTLIVQGDTTVTATFIDVATGVRPMAAVAVFTLEQNRPNPFSTETSFDFGLPRSSDVDLEIFDVEGKRAFSARIPSAPAGWNRIVFRGHDTRGRPLPSGVYFLRLKTSEAVRTKKLVIAR